MPAWPKWTGGWVRRCLFAGGQCQGLSSSTSDSFCISRMLIYVVRLHRAGWKVVYNPAAVMTHQHRRDSAQAGALLAKLHHLGSLMKFLWKYRFRLRPEV